MRWCRARWLILLLALGPVAAAGDTSPTVVTAVPGGGGRGEAIERFTVRFSEPIIPLGDPRAASPFTVACPVGGEGRWIDQKSWVYEFARPLPGGVSCGFTLKDKLASLRGAAVGGQRRFTIDTGGPAARAVLPSRYGGAIEEDQVFLVAANVAPDRASVAANAYCAVDGVGEKIAVDLLAPDLPGRLLAALGAGRYEVSGFLEEAGQPGALPAAAAERAAVTANMVALKCRRPLPPGHDVALVWGAGIAAPGGRTAGKDQRFDFTVRKAFEARFECSRVNPRAGCNPVEKARLRFTAPIAIETARAIRIRLASGREIAPDIAGEDGDGGRIAATVSDVTFKAPLPAGMAGSVRLPAGVVDESGRPLANATRFPLAVQFDVAPPLVKFAAPFGILEAGEGGVLPVTVRNVEPSLAGRALASVAGQVARVKGEDGAVADWLRRIDQANRNDFREEGEGKAAHTVNYTGTTPLLAKAAANPITVALPGKGKQFEVVGIPLAKPGFYVVELASPALGRALLGRPATRYVTAGALVTNMAVHFEWGRSSSLVWVTALDSGDPVPGADIRVTDSCTGRMLAEGRADAVGRLRVNGSLTEPETYGSCDENSPHPLMVSARKAGDFSFTLTSWGEGIRPYDFDLPYGYGETADIFHTLFDRALLRAGDTVNMKHIVRRPVAAGFAFTGARKGVLRLSHRGSDTHFDLPVAIGADGIGETRWTAPAAAPQGDYALSFVFG
ncbi:MAG TPA: MG2 domain-containing protein, partial [Sphingomonadaceae bacterium]|nr:MG2 domain-containing protein [Sphingomonadaceae bacterium]